VVGDQHVKAGRVASTHLEPIERRQRLLDRQVRAEGRHTRAAAREDIDGGGGAQTIAFDGPRSILDAHQRGVDVFEFGRRQRRAVLEVRLDVVDRLRDCADGGEKHRRKLARPEQAHDTGDSEQ
jgi:hypothetical protein